MDNPYQPSLAEQRNALTDRVTESLFALSAYKWIVALVGIVLYCSTPWRDKYFYYTIANNEGFGTTSDAVAVGIAGSVIATGFFFPLAVVLIGVGVGRCSRIQLLPRFDRFTLGWGIFATIVFVGMLIVESGYVIYAVQYSHHSATIIRSLLYIGFMYIWWCCSLCHGRLEQMGEPSDAPQPRNGAF